MPYTVQGEKMPSGTDFRDINFDYEYPEGLDLKPGSEFHTKLKSKIMSRASDSSAVISKRFDSWNEIDRTLTTYIPLKDAETALKKKDTTKPKAPIPELPGGTTGGKRTTVPTAGLQGEVDDFLSD